MHELWSANSAGASPERLREVMAEFAAGVTVVTTVWQGMPHAMTATAFSSVSLTPPLVLVCVGKSSRFHHSVTQAGTWAVSILSADQVQIARHFSHSGRDLATQFDGVPHTPAPHCGAPVLDGAQGWLECVTYDKHDAGDHTIVVGRVLATSVESADSAPLTYHRGTYSRLPDRR
ncbi:MAG: flavin reductase [Propionibacteriaceae bacterium]|nr:flavin reductase [Propionibacteriaceae bacterium]